jgi:hypothetical protein
MVHEIRKNSSQFDSGFIRSGMEFARDVEWQF